MHQFAGAAEYDLEENDKIGSDEE